MTHISKLAGSAQKFAHKNAPALLTSLGVSGAITTAYLAAKAGYAHNGRVRDDLPNGGYLTKREEFELVWDLYIPPVTAGVFTVACIVAASRVSSSRVAAAYSLLSVSERAFDEYRDKVVEQIGVKREQNVRDTIVEDHVKANPPSELVVLGSGTHICLEEYTGRYFNSDMESLRKAQNDINAKIVSERYVTLNDFYYLLSLPYTSESGRMGWEDNQLKLNFYTVLSDKGQPVLAFEYNYLKPL